MSDHPHIDGGAAVEHTKNALSHKIGPLPAGVWGLAILGGVAVAVLVRRSANDQATQDAADAIDQADQTDASGWDQPDPGGTTPGVGGGATGTGDGSYPEGGGGTTTTPTPSTTGAAAMARNATSNADWQRWSVQAMRPLGFDPGRTSAVLSAYLAGAKLDATGTAVLSAVMAKCGPPPHPPKHKADPGIHHQPPHQPAPHAGTKDHGQGGPVAHIGGHATDQPMPGHLAAQAAGGAFLPHHHHPKGNH